MSKNDIPIKEIVRRTVIVAASSERCCGVSAQICSGSERVRLSFAGNGLTNNGRSDIATARSYGAPQKAGIPRQFVSLFGAGERRRPGLSLGS